jgi:2-succinyl-5-enolpyruvyl-6-hydroxy-3-cyclohexene-1-carboxylate synthase
MPKLYSGAEIVFKCLEDQKVEHIFGYPGGAVLPIYDELKNHPTIKHILVRHEQGAGHAAEGYARSTGKPGVVLVTSGPGATNVVTALIDFSFAVWSPLDVLTPLKIIELPVSLFVISALVTSKCSATPIKSIFSKNSGIIDIEAEVIV